MEDLKTRILDLVKNSKKGSLDRKKIEKTLNLQSSSDFVQFSKTMDEMEKEFLLVRSGTGYLTRSQANLWEGKLSINRKGIGYIDRPGMPSIVVEKSEQKDAMDGDMVLVQTTGLPGEGKVVAVSQRAASHLIGTYERVRDKLVCRLDNPKLVDTPIKIEGDKSFTPIEGMKVVLHILKYNAPMKCEVERVIGYKDDPGVDILAVLLDHEIVPEFPKDVYDQVAKIPQEVTEQEKEGRTDLTKDITITIDGDDSKDFDDAVSVTKESNGFLLKVSIADVTHYVTAGSPLDIEAYKRGTSTYVTDRVVPMLPHELSNGICSLNPHVVRLTNTCEMHVSLAGEITNFTVYPSFICSTERMTYNNVNRILKNDPELKKTYEHLGTLIEDLRDCADAIRKRRIAEGAIDFNSTEAEIQVDETGKPIAIGPKPHGHAEEMIEDCMIAANVCVAEQMQFTNTPSVYRVHEAPSLRRMTDFANTSVFLGHPFSCPRNEVSPKEIQEYLRSCEDSPEYPVISMMMLRCMSKARYDAQCLGHFGLAEQDYLHFTSPIRRYPDLVVHRMLRKYLYEHCTSADELTNDEKFVQEAADQSSLRERASSDAEFECDDMKKAEFMMEHIGETFTGIITNVTSYGFYVQLPDTIEGLVRISNLKEDYFVFEEDRGQLVGERTRRTYRVGQTITIKVMGASKEARTIDFDVLDNRPSSSSYGKRPQRNSKGHSGNRTYGKPSNSNGNFSHDKKRSKHSSRKQSRYGEKGSSKNSYSKGKRKTYGR